MDKDRLRWLGLHLGVIEALGLVGNAARGQFKGTDAYPVPSCSFAPSARVSGYIFHCDCNTVPGLLDLGGLPGVVGLAAPRHVLAVNGRKNALFSPAEIDRAVAQVRAIYASAGVPLHFQHRWGDEGHRFYQRLMWPFVRGAMPRSNQP